MKSLFLEIKFEGGLGNQLFQYAAGRSLAAQCNIPFLLLNTDGYKNQSLNRKFALSNYNIKGSCLKSKFISNAFRVKTKLNAFVSFFGAWKLIEEREFKIQQINNQTGWLTSLKGYWQSDAYFKNIRNLLLKEMVPNHLHDLPEWIKQQNTVAIHVRRTDYLTEPRYGFIGMQYYRSAIEEIVNKINNPLFVFFSDDIDWCKENFKGENFIFCDDKNWQQDYLQLFLMSKCSHQIIGNSSFSWWGGWLNTNEDKIVMRPLNPFVEKSLLYESHYPEEWIAIENNA